MSIGSTTTGQEDSPVVRLPMSEGVQALGFNRPTRHNAINDALLDCLFSEFSALSNDDTTRVIIIKGMGPSFSSGAELGSGGPPRAASDDFMHMEDERVGRFLQIWDSPKAVIAQVHGHCIGIATALCTFCDLIVVADDVQVSWPKLPLGGGLLGPLSAFSVGVRKAKELSFQTGSTLSGLEAADIGWANRSVPASELDNVVATIAARIARTPPGLLRLKKAALNRIADKAGFRDAVQLGAVWDAIAHTDDGVREIAALVQALGMKGAIEHYGR
ncbi:MAG: enoyl-CoA hydratase-related protein [Gemmatimonas sp.]